MEIPTEFERFLGDSNGVEIYKRMGEPSLRRKTENDFFTASEMGLKWEAKFHRAHSQGAGTGTESKLGIYYAPLLVNLTLMAEVERDLRRLYLERAKDSQLWLYTHTVPHPLTRRLGRIDYRADLYRGSEKSVLLRAQITVSNSTSAPKSSLHR